ncbi:MAG: NAD-dependent epimerase/dehydratase family protein, partial [Bacteroidota bacterium]|nr:NAD-dependent epimerase/dehydratase family protein [Bacteroidota bacterium]
MKKRILIAGGSGLIGNAIVKAASPMGWECIILSRTAGPGKIQWSPADSAIDLDETQEFDAIINLAGENVSEGRWTEKRKEEVYKSRMNSTETLISFLKKGLLKTQCYIGASAIGIYGNRDEHSITETTPVQQGQDWFIKTVMDWEQKHEEIAALPIRTAMFRIGIVLSGEGGALNEILKKAKPGILPVFGSGNQIWSWIHISDLVKMIMFAIEHPE